MADESTNHVSLLAAVVIAVTGLIPVVWLLTTPSIDPSSADPDVVESTTTVVSTTVPVVSTTLPALAVDELDPSIVRVLQANGYAELAPESDMATELPPAVTRVLIDHGAVLTVVEEDPTAGEG